MTSLAMLNCVGKLLKADAIIGVYISDSVHGESEVLSIIGRCGSIPIKPSDEFHAL